MTTDPKDRITGVASVPPPDVVEAVPPAGGEAAGTVAPTDPRLRDGENGVAAEPPPGSLEPPPGENGEGAAG